ncbi:MAG: TIM barrel protein [Actinomycetota bacterium]
MTAPQIFASPWGLVGPDLPFGSLAELLPAVADAGLTGIEMPVIAFEAFPEAVGELDESRLAARLDELGLRLFPMILTFGGSCDDHLADFGRQLDLIGRWNSPVVNVHGGADAFSDDDARRFLRTAGEMAGDHGVALSHETHRGRILHTPWRTARLLDEVDDLWLTADLSHWVVTCERLPNDRADDLAVALARTRHVHARVGFDQGPQVPDPRDPRWSTFVDAHERWWTEAFAAIGARGDQITVTPEWGPPPYAPTDGSGVPLADNWELVQWSAERMDFLLA